MDFVGQHIDGCERQDGERALPIVDPASNETVRRVVLAGADQVDAAIAAAERAFESWRAVPPHRRAAVLSRYKHLLEAHATAIAALITEEHGKVLDDAMGEVARGIEIVDYACGIANLLKGKALKAIIADCIEGANGRAKAEPWVPQWMAFPPSAYTTRGGVGSVKSARRVAHELAVPAAPEPDAEDAQPLAA